MDDSLSVALYAGATIISQRRSVAIVTCPFHQGNSMYIYASNKVVCYGCGIRFAGPKWFWLAYKFGEKTAQEYTLAEYRAWEAFSGQPRSSTPVKIVVPQKATNVPRAEVVQLTREVFAWSQTELRTYPDARRYWRGRGLSDDLLRRYAGFLSPNLKGYLADRRLTDMGVAAGFLSDPGRLRMVNRLMIIDPDLRYFQARAINDTAKYRYIGPCDWSPVVSHLHSEEQGTIHVTEGIMNGLSIHQLGYDVLVPWGAGNVLALIEALQEYVARQWKIVLWLDNDVRSVTRPDLPTASESLARRVRTALAPYPIESTHALQGKDSNAWLRAAPRVFARHVAALAA